MVIRNSFTFSHRVSKLFQPLSIIPKDGEVKHQEFTSRSQKLMLELGIIKQASPGCYHLLPLGVKSLEKLINIVNTEMKAVGAQKIVFPTLTSAKLWHTSGRLEMASSELFKVKDRHNQNYILSPTYEETAGELLASLSVSYKQLPLLLYQITSKFRDEMKPRFGLMRGKQFVMKDLYSFDIDEISAKQTYEMVRNSYNRIFDLIGINFVRVLGSSGIMGGEVSHEYHYKAELGEDKILTCHKCSYSANTEVSGEEKCPNCGSSDVEINFGIEVGHTFLLGDKYSKAFKTTYLSKEGKPEILYMGSYGLGLSRILAASVEVLSNENELRWPSSIAPYNVVVLPPKSGSKEESHIRESGLTEQLLTQLETIDCLKDNVLLDDRISLTIGRRYLEGKRFGYPLIIALGKKIIEDPPLYEISNLRTNKQLYLSTNDLLKYVRENVVL